MNRWIVNKLGLVNFWYYDVEEFELEDGKLLLRGSNGSGKSVTMQSFVPLLLDGNKAPHRLDPFGSKARKLENYLLDEDTNEKTAYLYMEFKRRETDNYMTIGMGMKAVKNKPLESWYFAVTDNRRIGKDLLLYKESEGRIPLTKKQLENTIAEGGFFTIAQKVYMAKVNELLFGFDTVEQYEELLDLLINVRSPKLSKDFKPTEMYRILTESLKVLTEDDLRPMSEAMENMDTLTGRLEEYEQAKKACKNIAYHYNQYNKYCLLEKATKAVTAHEKWVANDKRLTTLIKEQKSGQDTLEQTLKELSDKENLRLQVDKQYEELSKEKAFEVEQELSKLLREQADYTQQLKAKEQQTDKKRSTEIAVQHKLSDQDQKCEQIKDEISEAVDQLEEYEQELYLEAVGDVSIQLRESSDAYVFIPIYASLDKHRERLKQGREAMTIYERLKNQEESLLEKKDQLEGQKAMVKKDRDRLEELFIDEKENYKAKIHEWHKETKYFTITEDELGTIYKKAEHIEEQKHGYELEDYLKEIRSRHERQMDQQIYDKNQQALRIDQEIGQLIDEIKALKSVKEIAPPRTKGVRANRQRLDEAEIPYLPLYQAIDFAKETPAHVKTAIEGAFSEMGILDALIVEPKHQELVMSFGESQYDKYLFTKSNLMKYNLSAYLKVEQDVLGKLSYGAVDEVLTGIFLGAEDGDSINEKGHYKLGSLYGKYNQNYELQYIGASSRKQHRERVIAEKQAQSEAWHQEKIQIEQEISRLKQIRQVLIKEYEHRPTTRDLLAGIIELGKYQDHYELIESQRLAASEAYLIGIQALKVQKNKVFEVFEGLSVPHNLEIVEEVLEAIMSYREVLMRIEKLQYGLLSAQQIRDQIRENLEEVREDLDQLYYDMTQLTQKISRLNTQITALEETLKAMNLNTLREQIAWCIEQKNLLPPQITGLSTRKGSLEEKIQTLGKQIQELGVLIETLREEDQKALIIFEEEIGLGYVMISTDNNLLDLAEQVEQEHGHLVKKTKEEYFSDLMTSMRDNNAPLREYHLQSTQLFEGVQRTRQDLIAKTDGKTLSFRGLTEYIERSIDEFGMLISDEERRVFEEVLLNTISSKITSKIYLSKLWVEKINNHMESMQTSSSLRLSLKWLPKKSDAEDQMDIAELGTILQRGDRCSQEDLKKLAKHFADKVKETLRMYDGTGESRNYHTIIKEVLDYRNWYEFKLYYMKDNEKRKELTNNAFFQFSGGEKAMSMYVPLFSAVYARYDSGKAICPRLVAMDEAFAGVDENNIRDMFRILGDLDLDYILNSQYLWGDYDSVKQLAICEIIREANDDAVLVLRYSWNGTERTLLA